MADEDVSSADATLACLRGYAACVRGAQEKGVIIGSGVYEPGKVKDKPAMQQAYQAKTYKGEHIMSILFINGSPNHHGNTASLAAALLKGKEYETLNLTDYTIGAYGQQLPGDGLDAVVAAMEKRIRL